MDRYATNRPCKKCGAANAKTEYQDAEKALTGREGKFPLMRRECKRCGYAWYELPLDAPDLGDVTGKKGRHIESWDANAFCLCGEKVVAYKDGLFVCPNAGKKVGAA